MESLSIHQINILRNLAFKEKARFAEINSEKLPNDQFNYHLKKLVDDKYLNKDLENYYSLTTLGKQVISHYDVFSLKYEKQSKIHLVPVCFQENKNGEIEYLIHKRKKHPFFGWMGFPSGKAKFGESYEEEVLRELEEETGITGKPELKIIKHMIVIQEDTKEVLEDKLFIYFVIKDFSTDLKETTMEGENFWMTEKELFTNEKVYADMKWALENIHAENLVYIETFEEIQNI